MDSQVTHEGIASVLTNLMPKLLRFAVSLTKNKVNNLTTYFDKNMTFFKSLKLRGIPTTLLIRNKRIIAKKEGIFSYNQNSLEQINNFFN